jgi:glycosyltransferase involved in cell wall biosynthesis
MLISIVSGTFNRLPLLTKMIHSIRAHLHSGVPYEIVIVDGGSQDGTLEWCRAQPDIHLIEQGELRGAVRAFTDGAYAARGKYVCLANDDIEVIDYSILAAFAYLEEHPTCGAVAFSDDRPAQSKPAGFAVQTMTVLSPEGQIISIPYAQVGLYRRWLGDLCGWWGADDPDFPAITYGGDNYLTARLVEYGYSVDAVQGVRVKDIVAPDSLREHNIRQELNKPSAYYQRFVTPPQMKAHPTVSNPERPARRRILYLPIFESSYPHHRIMKRGLREALMRLWEMIEVDYNNEPYDLPALVDAWQPDILFLQCQRGLIECVPAIHAAHPEILILNWNGDVYLDALIDSATLQWLKAGVDVQLCVNGAALPVYEQHGIKAAYWQCAYEPVHEREHFDPLDIVFMGSAYSPKRIELADLLTSLPYKVHLVGTGWVNYPDHNAGNTTYEFEVSNAIRRAATIEIGDNQYHTDTGFISNRVFDCLAAGGALLLHQKVDRLEEFTGLKAGLHYIVWDDFEDLKTKIAYYMNPRHEKARAKIVKRAYAYVREHHSFGARLRELFNEILPRVL